MHAKGFRCFYEFIGYSGWSPALQWGYLLSQINLARFNWPKSKVYAALKGIADHFQRQHDRERAINSNISASTQVDNKDDNADSRDPVDQAGYFVLTTNADGMFGQNDFPLDRVYTTQGDYSRMQCLKPCRRDAVWPILTNIAAALPAISPATQEITDSSKIPKCPHCSGPVMMNVRGGNWFLEWPHASQQARYRKWLELHLQRAAQRSKPVVILEIGVGFNTPGVVRYPMEDLARSYGDVCKLIRINAFRPEVPEEVDGESAVGLQVDAEEALCALQQALDSNI
jgi:NAD-dependent SIR2 family protein deacetylase